MTSDEFTRAMADIMEFNRRALALTDQQQYRLRDLIMEAPTGLYMLPIAELHAMVDRVIAEDAPQENP